MKKIIIANWKMYYGPIKAGAWVRAFRRERLPKDLEVAVAAPTISLSSVRATLGRALAPVLAAQNAFWANEGAYTGEVSPTMLSELGVSYCLVGHSERRLNLCETDEMVAKKARALQFAGISPVICVGESEADRRRGNAKKIVRKQVQTAIEGIKGDGRAPAVIAYEPVWAIGSGKPCTALDARDMHETIRAVLKNKFGSAADAIRIIYGGSVDIRNILEFLSTTSIDGALVGGASLDPRAFGLLCRSAVPS